MFHRFTRWFLAYFRLDLDAVCELSRGMGDHDYHDYVDDIHGQPDHFVHLTCIRCGKKFRI